MSEGAASLQVEEEVLEEVPIYPGVPTWVAMAEVCRPVLGAYLAGVVEEAPLRGLVERAEHSFGRRRVAERGMRVMGHPRILRSASSAALEAVVGPVLTEMAFLEDLHVRISQHPVWGAAQRIVALAVTGRGEESVLVGHSFPTWLTSEALVEEAVLLPFVEPAAAGLPNVIVAVQREEAAAVLVDLPLSR